MNLLKVLRGGQITMPKKIREQLKINEGDLLEIKLKDGGIYLKPKTIIDRESILSKNGEKLVNEALEEYQRKDIVGEFDTAEDAIQALKNVETWKLFTPKHLLEIIKNYTNIFEGRIDKNYRFIFLIENNQYVFLRCGSHDKFF